jgi:hypothetical protein
MYEDSPSGGSAFGASAGFASGSRSLRALWHIKLRPGSRARFVANEVNDEHED